MQAPRLGRGPPRRVNTNASASIDTAASSFRRHVASRFASQLRIGRNMTTTHGHDRNGEAARAVQPLPLTVPQAARALAIGRTTLYELIGERRIETVHIGRCTRVPVEAVRAFVEAERARR